MAYQNVGKPRFFIDNYQYLRNLGLDPEEYMVDSNFLQDDNSQWKTIFDNEDAFVLDPMEAKPFINASAYRDYMKFAIPMGTQVAIMDFTGNMKWYCAILNHDIGDTDSFIHSMQFSEGVEIANTENDPQFTRVLNTGHATTPHNGSSIFYTDLVPSSDMKYTGFLMQAGMNMEGNLSEVNIGTISTGVMYTMPHSPELKLTMEFVHDGIDSITTTGGSTISNIRYVGAPNWINKGKYSSPFGVGDYSENRYLDGSMRAGKRTWKLNFKHISDSDIFSSNSMRSNFTETLTGYDDDLDASNQFEYNMFTDDSFIAQVWNKTLGGALTFIFQPDSSNDNPDQFYLCKFDQDSLSVRQSAYKSYDISIKITEVW